MQFLAGWIANNWRRTVTSNVIGLNIKVRPIDVVWRTRKEECEVELMKILNVKELDTSSPEYFQQRMAAAKVVLDGLSVRDREKLEAEVVKIREKGHEPEVQQQCVCRKSNCRKGSDELPVSIQTRRQACRAKNT